MQKHLSILIIGSSLVGTATYSMDWSMSKRGDGEIAEVTFDACALADWHQANEWVPKDHYRLLQDPSSVLKFGKKKEKKEVDGVSKEIKERFGRRYDYCTVNGSDLDASLAASHTSISHPAFKVLDPINAMLYRKQVVRILNADSTVAYVRGDSVADLEQLYRKTASVHEKAHLLSMIDGLKGHTISQDVPQSRNGQRKNSLI